MAYFNQSTNYISKGTNRETKNLIISSRKTTAIISTQPSLDTLLTAEIPEIYFANNLEIPILLIGLKKKTQTAENRYFII